ncbi:MAG TPA: allophanate hydrolase [Burkholderiales bacterium]|nr:allophanate hydrolase [Burkholderiales bacterium]
MSTQTESLDIARLRERYLSGALDPQRVVALLLERIERRGDDKLWIDRVPRAALEARAAELLRRRPDELPLYGIPFAIKDNIDLAGHPTTAACPEFAYTPGESAPVVQRLLDAGAIAIGKTNLDQFATGLVGTRSPYGACANPFDERYISGGSSSGSAVAVAAGLVSFSLGTDTAGSGRVPAAFNNLVGLKPTLGLLSTRGVVPACRSLDCVSIFGLTVRDAQAVLQVTQGFDRGDPFSRAAPAGPEIAFGACFRFGVPRPAQLEFFGDRDAAELYRTALARLESLGGERIELDFEPFFEAARLLYEGPWVAERWLAVRDLLERKPEALHPVTRRVIERATAFSAADAFAASYRMQALRRRAEAAWSEVDLLVTPSAPTIYTRAEVEADPIALNSRLGTYTNFVNLLDMSGLAVPAGFRADGLPFGVTLLAPAFHDGALAGLGERLQRAQGLPLGATGIELPPAQQSPAAARPATVQLVVCGAHMSGLPLNRELTERNARLVRRARTAARYRFYALEAFSPPRPGLVRSEPGAAIEVEVWELPATAFGGFVDGIPAPLGIGTVELEDGAQLRGFVCEHYATREAREITRLGGWRAYLAQRAELAKAG